MKSILFIPLVHLLIGCESEPNLFSPIDTNGESNDVPFALNKVFIVIATAMALTGCASTRVINPNRPSELSAISIKPDQKVRVTMSNGQWFIVSNLQVKPDSTRFFTEWLDGRKFLTVATSDIKEITHTRRGKGALQGLGFGLLAGTTLGVIVGAVVKASTPDPCEDADQIGEIFSRDCALGLGSAVHETLPLLYGTLGFLAGGLGGTFIGAAVGSKSEYQFQTSGMSIKCSASGCQNTNDYARHAGKSFYQCSHCQRWWCNDHGRKSNLCPACQKVI
jgi:hypothetical protein